MSGRWWWCALVLAACGGEEAISIDFQAVVGEEAFSCDGAYSVGQDGVTVRPIDLRFYLHDLRLVDEAGEEVAFTPDEDAWQRDGVVLLDFEDDSGSCNTGSAGTHTAVTGTVDGAERVAGIRFTVGVPEDQNHLDAAVEPAPFNAQGMWWSWSGGFKYMKVDVETDTKPTVFFHLGATGCTGDPGVGYTCGYAHRPTITLDGLTIGENTVVFDLASLYAGIAVDGEQAEGDSLPGCMSFTGDPECPPMISALGLGFMDAEPPASQSAFTIGAR